MPKRHPLPVARSRISSAREPSRVYDSSKNKAVCFFSVGSPSGFKELYNFGIRETLVSYFYMKKSLAYWDEMLPQFKREGGIFMTDSGAFSFMGMFRGDEADEKMATEEFWLPYLEEYVAWLREHKDYIFCAANLDLDKIVGQRIVDKWNKKYFEPLEKEGLQIVYVAHEEEGGDRRDFLRRFEYYCQRYQYVGANQMWKSCSAQIFQLVKRYKVRVHGFAWTDLPLLRKHPFFSVDSVTWLGGVRFGITYDYDGKNFRSIDATKKYIRKVRKTRYREQGFDLQGIKEEKRIPINQMNLFGWMGFRREFLKVANLKLHNQYVSHYER